jgi:uncharacterized protein
MTKIWIILGDACNMSCAYCAEHNIITKLQDTTVVTDTFIQWLNDIVASDECVINFYGGEPTLYFSTIKEIMSKVNHNAHFTTMTNGKNLTEEMVDFFNDNQITVNFSWDGQNTAITRNEDVLSTGTALHPIYKVKDLWVNATLTTQSYPLSIAEGLKPVVEKYIKINSYPCRINIGLATDICGDASLFDYDYQRIYDEMCIVLKRGIKQEPAFEQIYVRHLFLLNKFWVTKSTPTLLIDVDTKGNLYMCPFRREKAGHISDFDAYQNECATFKGKTINHTCESCPVVSICDKGCWYNHGNKEKLLRQCNLRKAFYMPILNMCMGALDE